MPNSKNADVRIKVIDRCLSDRTRWYSTAEMMRLCNQELETNGGNKAIGSVWLNEFIVFLPCQKE